jgi:hypothetical protein
MLKEQESYETFHDEDIEVLMEELEPIIESKGRRRYLLWSSLLLFVMMLTSFATVLVERKGRLSLSDYVFGNVKNIDTTVPRQKLTNISYDDRAILINGERQLLIVGAIHYPRSSRGMWKHLLQNAKEAGINTIDTYVFWNLHEPIEGHYDFDDLLEFLKAVQKENLWVNLRIGPYVCAGNNL